jgi:hypothetical protein
MVAIFGNQLSKTYIQHAAELGSVVATFGNQSAIQQSQPRIIPDSRPIL